MNGGSHKRLVILGPPGAGKGTQGKLLSETMGLRHIASGDLVRQHQANETDLGLLSRSYYSKGLLVPDEITIKIVLPDVLAYSSGFILDGFPRNVSQAKRLDEATGSRGSASRPDSPYHRLPRGYDAPLGQPPSVPHMQARISHHVCSTSQLRPLRRLRRTPFPAGRRHPGGHRHPHGGVSRPNPPLGRILPQPEQADGSLRKRQRANCPPSAASMPGRHPT